MLEEIKKEFEKFPIKKVSYDTDEGQTFVAELIAVDKRNLWQFIEQKLTEAIKQNDSGIIVMPDFINIYNASTDRCDALKGHCACGACHTLDDQIKKIVKRAKIDLLGEIKIETTDKQQKLVNSRILYVKDECWGIVGDIDVEIKLLGDVIKGVSSKINELKGDK